METGHISQDFATKGPIRYLKMANHVQKLPTLVIFGHVFAISRCLRGLLVAKSLHILVEQVISFEMSSQTSKSDKY